MQIIGHRGAMGLAPENTLKSFRKALQLGVDGIEFDVQNIDANLVIFHDETLDRTTNGDGPLAKCSFQQLRHLDAGEGEQIPTLAEAVELIDDKAFINIELKGQNVALLVVDLMNWSSRHQHDFIISSYHFSELSMVRKIDSDIRLGVIVDHDIEKAIDFAEAVNAYSFHPCLELVDQNLVDRVQQKNMKIFVHTVNKLEDIDRVRRLGVDGVFTDYPDRI